MGIASEIKELTHNIASSHDDRTRKIREIGEEVKGARLEARDMIKSFADSRRETGRQLRSDLARDKTSRTPEVKGILRESQNILKSFEKSRKEAGARLREDLSRGTAERHPEVKRTLEGARKLTKEFRSSRQNVSYQLREDLGGSRVKAKSEVEKLLKEFQTFRREAGNQLRRDLAQSKADMESDIKRMQSDFRESRGNVRADLKEVRAAWQGLAGMIQARQGGTAIPLEAEAPAAEEGNSDLETKMLATVSGYPTGGITLADLSSILGVAPVVLGRLSKSLMKRGEIRKEGKLYFPAAG